MTRWAQGADKIQELLDLGDLQQMTKAESDGQLLLEKARRTLKSATALTETDLESSYTLVYDAARFACSALLVQQGLRTTSRGGHYALEQAMRAQFQAHFRSFGELRRRRNVLEYPTASGTGLSRSEVDDAIEDAGSVVRAAARLLPYLRPFHEVDR